jgi:gamma-glutamyltranspeptidase
MEHQAVGETNAPRSTLRSTLVMKGGRPYLIMGSPGGDDHVMRTMLT